MARLRFTFSIPAFAVCLLLLLIGCSDDEGSVGGGSTPTDLIQVEFRNPIEIEIDPELQLALLLHDRSSPSGPALQLIDLEAKQVLATQFIDYFDVYDVEFIDENQACFAGRPHGNVGYAVYFFDLETLTEVGEVMTADTSGTHGYLDVTDDDARVYYSHAGGGGKDAVYAISTSSRSLIDADNDGVAPFGFDNALVAETFAGPARVFFDDETESIVACNLNGGFVTVIDHSLWGNLQRGADIAYPIPGVTRISTEHGSVADVRADAVTFGAGIYGVAGTSGNVPYLSRFRIGFPGVDIVEPYTDRTWVYRNRDVKIHPREDVFSMFVLQEDTSGVSIGQYRLSNLVEVAASPYRTRHISEETIAAVGLDVINDRLIVADRESERLEIISISP